MSFPRRRKFKAKVRLLFHETFPGWKVLPYEEGTESIKFIIYHMHRCQVEKSFPMKRELKACTRPQTDGRASVLKSPSLRRWNWKSLLPILFNGVVWVEKSFPMKRELKAENRDLSWEDVSRLKSPSLWRGNWKRRGRMGVWCHDAVEKSFPMKRELKVKAAHLGRTIDIVEKSFPMKRELKAFCNVPCRAWNAVEKSFPMKRELKDAKQ